MNKITKKSLQTSIICLIALGFCTMRAAELPADSRAVLGQAFAEPQAEGTIRALILGSGDHHHFPRYFIGTDSATLRAAGGIDVAAALNLEEALSLLPKADVLVFSGNHGMYGEGRFQQALQNHAVGGKGIVLVHAAVWNHPRWEDYNKRFVGGGSSGHGFGEIEVSVKNADHPVMQGVPATFAITDESYHHEFRADADVKVLAENGPDDRTRRPHASVWVVNDPEARIVCMTFGHDGRAHDNPAYKTILINAVKWVAERP